MTDPIEIVRSHNAWRRGLIDDNPYTPREIGAALDDLANECERSRRILDRIAYLCTHTHESKEEFCRRVQSVLKSGGQVDG